jgi:NAD(P)-dependent dehydrogenase (short-subunit alcohol dehydrogenase family)
VRENNMTKSIFDLSGRVVVVTGAGSGMGRAICEAMAESGANVVPVDINESAARETAQLISHHSTRVMPLQADAFEEVDIKNTVAKTLNEFGTIDVVFAHAAIVDTTPAKIHETTVEDWDRIVSSYLRGILVLMKSVFPIMMEKGRGCFITTSAGTALWPLPPVGDLHLATSYITGKTAAIMLTKLAARQYGEYGIRANVICPGYHRSLHHEKDPAGLEEMEKFILGVTPLKRVGLASDIKGLAIYLASDASSFVSGQVFVEDGGFTA